MRYMSKKQQGMTMGSIGLMVLGICLVVLLVLKIAPVYMNHGKVKSALESVANIPEIETQSKSEVRRSLQKRFDVNGIDSLPKDAIKITKFGDYLKVQIQYNIERQIISNLYILVKFDEQIEVGNE